MCNLGGLFDMIEYGVVANPSFGLLDFLFRPPVHRGDPRVPEFCLSTYRWRIEDNIREFLHKYLSSHLQEQKLHYYEEYLGYFSIGEPTIPRIIKLEDSEILIMLHIIFKNVCVPKYLWNELYYESDSGRILKVLPDCIRAEKTFRIFEYVDWFIISGDLKKEFWYYFNWFHID